MTSPSEPRQFWIYQNSLGHLVVSPQQLTAPNLHGEMYVVEKSAYDALSLRVKELAGELNTAEGAARGSADLVQMQRERIVELETAMVKFSNAETTCGLALLKEREINKVLTDALEDIVQGDDFYGVAREALAKAEELKSK